MKFAVLSIIKNVLFNSFYENCIFYCNIIILFYSFVILYLDYVSSTKVYLSICIYLQLNVH